LSFFFLSFFLSFFYSPSLFCNETFLRDSNKNNGAFIMGTKWMDGKYLGVQHFWVDLDGMACCCILLG
jgi:hypothetical protein